LSKIETYIDNGETVTNIFSDGTEEVLTYFKNSKDCHLVGKYKGQITGKLIMGLILPTKKDIEVRIAELKINLSEKQLEDFEKEKEITELEVTK